MGRKLRLLLGAATASRPPTPAAPRVRGCRQQRPRPPLGSWRPWRRMPSFRELLRSASTDPGTPVGRAARFPHRGCGAGLHHTRADLGGDHRTPGRPLVLTRAFAPVTLQTVSHAASAASCLPSSGNPGPVGRQTSLVRHKGSGHDTERRRATPGSTGGRCPGIGRGPSWPLAARRCPRGPHPWVQCAPCGGSHTSRAPTGHFAARPYSCFPPPPTSPGPDTTALPCPHERSSSPQSQMHRRYGHRGSGAVRKTPRLSCSSSLLGSAPRPGMRGHWAGGVSQRSLATRHTARATTAATTRA